MPFSRKLFCFHSSSDIVPKLIVLSLSTPWPLRVILCQTDFSFRLHSHIASLLYSNWFPYSLLQLTLSPFFSHRHWTELPAGAFSSYSHCTRLTHRLLASPCVSSSPPLLQNIFRPPLQALQAREKSSSSSVTTVTDLHLVMWRQVVSSLLLPLHIRQGTRNTNAATYGSSHFTPARPIRHPLQITIIYARATLTPPLTDHHTRRPRDPFAAN